MINSKHNSDFQLPVRVRPLLGTLVEVRCIGVRDDVITETFNEAQRLEKIFNRFDPDSEASRYGQRVQDPSCSPEFRDLMQLSDQIQNISRGAFRTIDTDGALDLSGIAKGFIVDTMVSFLLKRAPGAQGIINAGGDIRFFNQKNLEVTLRLGPAENPIWRKWRCPHEAVATSSPSLTTTDNHSSTRYWNSLRPPLEPQDTVSVSAPSCAVADALTKVGFFADPEIIQDCCTTFQATLMIFNFQGDPLETYGPHPLP